MIDRFGQYLHKDWPGKTHAESDLAAKRQQEAADLTAHPGPKGWNQYGGWLDGPQLEATGRDDGENFQNGFVDVCDTPYTETIDACRRIGYRMHQVRAGQDN